ncbi:MAG: DUF7121 family protein [Methanobacteriota archaeon]
MVRRKSLSELEQAEIKLQSLVERRGTLNEEANVLRQERDLVHEKKREVASVFRELKGRRSGLIGQARAHREKRDDFQRKAKELIELKRKLRARGRTSAGEEFRLVKRQISEMEMRQQTATLTLREENRLLEGLKAKMQRLKDLESLKADEEKLAKEVKDLDATITDLFAVADREHKAAAEASEAARQLDGGLDELLQTLKTLAAEGDKHHEAYLEAREKADEIHAKVVEMREKVLASREARRAEARESRDLLRAQNRAARRALYDEEKLEESADAAFRSLLQKGRVEIGR